MKEKEPAEIEIMYREQIVGKVKRVAHGWLAVSEFFGEMGRWPSKQQAMLAVVKMAEKTLGRLPISGDGTGCGPEDGDRGGGAGEQESG